MDRSRWFVVLGSLTGAAFVGVAAASVWTGQWGYGFLAWNLVLAWVPVALAAAIWRATIRRSPLIVLLLLLTLWLLFLPNAPYLVTDLVHLGDQPDALPLVVDALLLSIGAIVGLLAGLFSLRLVELAVRRRAGATASRLSVALAIPLASVGVYLGRSLRWNSWDVLTEPSSVLGRLLNALQDPLTHGGALLFVAAFSLFLAAAYATYLRMARQPVSDQPRP
jgi:uncharacterized membrane protein